MVAWSTRCGFARIGLTQVGDPRAHHQKCVFHCVSVDRLLAGVASMLAVVVSKDKEVADLVVMSRDITEGWLLAQRVAEGDPGGKDLVTRVVGLGDVSGGDKQQRRVEVSCEAISCLRCSSCQGLSCG